MSEAYEVCRGNLASLVAWYDGHAGSRNEATTRFQLIDRLFFECLGWNRDDVVLEESRGKEYADYTFSLFRPVLIVEAKREGESFELPAGPLRLQHSIPSLFRDYPQLKDAIEQAARYCQARGVPYGAVSNGHQIVAFVATRNDGTAPLDGKAEVFTSLPSMLEHFLDLWQMLSRSGVEEKKLQYRLIGNTPDLPGKLSARLSHYPGTKGRNVVQTDLQILSEVVIEDLIRSSDLEPRFLEECYCQSGALSQFALTSKTILTARYAALFDAGEAGPSLVPAMTKDGVSPELIGVSLARRPILLLGDVGVGKTTFIRHLIKVEARGIFEDAVALYLDLGSQATLSADMKTFVLDEIERQLQDSYEIDVYERNFVRGVYNRELKRFASGIYRDIRESDPAQFKEKEIEHLQALLAKKDQHLKSALEHISKGRKKQIVIFLDNSDQRDERTQEQAFLIAQEFAESWPMLVYVSLRPETFYRSKKIGTLTGYHAKAFTILPPRIDLVVKRRLKFAMKLTSGEIPISSLARIGVNLQKLRTIVRIMLDSFEAHDDLMELIDNVSAGNVRMALDFIKAFIGSGHIDTQKMLDIYAESGRYDIALHEFLRAIIFGDTVYYDPSISPIANLFDISSLDGKEHFLVPLAIGILNNPTGPNTRDGFVETHKLYDRLQGLGFTADQIDIAIARACDKHLIETSARQIPERNGNMPLALRPTTTGIYHVERLASDFTYIDTIVVDTPILDSDSRDGILDVEKLGERITRVERFAAYLDGQWGGLEAHASGFSWRSASEAIARQTTAIKRSISANRPFGPHKT